MDLSNLPHHPFSSAVPGTAGSRKGRKSECSSPQGCAGWREGDRQTQRLLQNALDCPETAWKQSDRGSSFSCPQVLLLHSWEGILESPQGQFMDQWASSLCCVAGFALKTLLSSSPFAREGTRCYSTGFSLLIYAFLTRSHKNGRTQHALPPYPQLILCSIFLDAAIKISAIFAFLADKNPRFPICCLLGWLYGSNEGQQPQVWTQILLLILMSRASSFCFIQKNHWICPSLLCVPYKARPMGQTQLLRKMPGDTVAGNTCVGDKTNSSDLWQEIISQSQCAAGSAWKSPPCDACRGSVFTAYPTRSWRTRKYLKY